MQIKRFVIAILALYSFSVFAITEKEAARFYLKKLEKTFASINPEALPTGRALYLKSVEVNDLMKEGDALGSQFGTATQPPGRYHICRKAGISLYSYWHSLLNSIPTLTPDEALQDLNKDLKACKSITK